MAARITLKSALMDIATELQAIKAESCEDYVKSRNKVWRRAKFLFDNEIDVEVQVANNEQKGYSSEEIGLPTIPMKTKKETGERQTADYVVYWKWKAEPIECFRKMGIIFERKEVSDFHNTMIHNYDRFDREIERFLNDEKTKLMMVLVEGSRQDALVFTPPKRYNGNDIKFMIAAKIGAISSIQVRGIHICWQGSRKASANSIKPYISHFFEKNIEFVLRDYLGDIIKGNFEGIPERTGATLAKPAQPKPATPKRTYKKRTTKAKVKS